MVRKSLKGGHATSFPSEYFGVDSGRYFPEPFSNPGTNAYGDHLPVSNGANAGIEGFVGPNLAPYPNSNGQMTGGGARKLRRKRRRSSKNKKRTCDRRKKTMRKRKRNKSKKSNRRRRVSRRR